METNNDRYSQSEKSRIEQQIFEFSEKSSNDSSNEKTQTIPKLTQVSSVEDEPENEPWEIQQSAPRTSRTGRVSNYIMPNMLREVKQCLANAFPADNTIFELLEKMFSKLGIKFQIWAFDAILTCLIFIRDKSTLLTQKKFSATIEAISSTLEKYKHKFLSKQTFNAQQIKLINSQYTLCIDYLKVYDEENQSFDRLCQQGDYKRAEFFCRMLTSRKNLVGKFLKIISHVESSLLDKKIIYELMSKVKVPGKKHE